MNLRSIWGWSIEINSTVVLRDILEGFATRQCPEQLYFYYRTGQNREALRKFGECIFFVAKYDILF